MQIVYDPQTVGTDREDCSPASLRYSVYRFLGSTDCWHKQRKLKSAQSLLFSVQISPGLEIVGTNREDCSLTSLCYSVYEFPRVYRLLAQTEKTVARPVFAIQSTDFSGLQIVGTNREDCSPASLRYSVYRFLGSTDCWHKQRRL